MIMNRNELQELSSIRVVEAKSLIENNYYAGGYYLLGYSVECALKACVAKQINQHDLPDKKFINDIYTHNLEKLLDNSGLKNIFYQQLKLKMNWVIVKEWSEQSRYDSHISKLRASELYTACTDEANGVLTWVKKFW